MSLVAGERNDYRKESPQELMGARRSCQGRGGHLKISQAPIVADSGFPASQKLQNKRGYPKKQLLQAWDLYK